MQIKIHSTNFELTPAIDEYVNKKMPDVKMNDVSIYNTPRNDVAFLYLAGSRSVVVLHLGVCIYFRDLRKSSIEISALLTCDFKRNWATSLCNGMESVGSPGFCSIA